MAKIKCYCFITLWCLQVILVTSQDNNSNDSSQVIETHYSGRSPTQTTEDIRNADPGEIFRKFGQQLNDQQQQNNGGGFGGGNYDNRNNNRDIFIFSHLDGKAKKDTTQSVPILYHFEKCDSSYVIYVLGKKREGEKKISSKEMGEKGRDFLTPFPFNMTSQESHFSKVRYKIGTDWVVSQKSNNKSNDRTAQTNRLSISKQDNFSKPIAPTTRSPFDDPNRYNLPKQQVLQGAFVNGQRYRENTNVKGRYDERRYNPRLQPVPGEYDIYNDPNYSNIENQDPRNIPKYDSNSHNRPKNKFDSAYRYYERFPERQNDQFRDPNYNPQYDIKHPKAPGVLGGWLPDLQGECRPGCENLDRDVNVNTLYGRVNGFYTYLYDGPRVPLYARPGYAHTDKVKAKVATFLGIPYAQAPIDTARLMPPRPHRGWQSIDAVDWPPVCPQPLQYLGVLKNAPLVDEDCLYLNVFTPTVESTVSQQFPVMIYIHGGHFQHGSANEFPGHQLAANGQVVVVAINYRLGALGFLSTGDHHAPGNYGLLDMAMAVKWVYDNVYAFQGDAKKITLFGPDAGAAAAGLLAVMPKTRHMVRRVIAISGSPFADWAVFNDKFRPMNTSLVYGEKIGCTIEASWKLVDCIRNREWNELAALEFKPEIGTWPWAPVVQKNISVPEDTHHIEWHKDDFIALPELVNVMYENQEYHPEFQYLTGVAKDDASYMLYQNKTLAPDYEIGWDFFDVMVRDHINQYNYTLNPEGTFSKQLFFYERSYSIIQNCPEEFVNFWSDYFFKAPQDAIVKTLVQNRVDTYMYVQNTTVEALRLPWWRRITHNLEYYFLTGAPFMDDVFFPDKHRISRNLWTEGDRNMSEFFIYAMANFSWYGNPTPKNILGVHWDMVTPGEIQKYLAVNTTENSTTLWNYRQKECAFWTEYLPSVIGYITPTYPPTTEFWWEPESPLQIAFWSMSTTCLFMLAILVVTCLLWRNAKFKNKDRYGSAADDRSMKNFPADFDHLMHEQVMPYHTKDLSPTLSRRTMRTPVNESMPPSEFVRTPSVHSLGALGLRPIPPPVPGHAPPPMTPSMQQKSLPPTPHMAHRDGIATPRGASGAQTPVMGGQRLGATTPVHMNGGLIITGNGMMNGGMQAGQQQYQYQYPTGQQMTSTMNSHRGVVVGPGEMPNGAGPFVNAALHNTSDDSILTNQSSRTSLQGAAAAARTQQQQLRNSQRSSAAATHPQQPSLESLGGTRFNPASIADHPLNNGGNRQMQMANNYVPEPLGVPKSAGKLMPGRMSSSGPNQNGGRPTSSAGPSPVKANGHGGGGHSRPQSRAGRAGSGRANGGIPFTAV